MASDQERVIPAAEAERLEREGVTRSRHLLDKCTRLTIAEAVMLIDEIDRLLAELARKDKVLRRIADDAASYGPSSRYERSILFAALDRIAGDAESALEEQP